MIFVVLTDPDFNLILCVYFSLDTADVVVVVVVVVVVLMETAGLLILNVD